MGNSGLSLWKREVILELVRAVPKDGAYCRDGEVCSDCPQHTNARELLGGGGVLLPRIAGAVVRGQLSKEGREPDTGVALRKIACV